MAQNETQQHIRTIDIAHNIIDNIDNGIIILNDTLQIKHYNRWLELHTGLKESDLLEKELPEVFTNINAKTLLRKIKTALKIQTPTFYTATTSKYLIPIKINNLKHPEYEFMQQDVSIIPFDEEKNLVALILTDQTNMATANQMLKNNLLTIERLNSELIKERDTIDKKVLLLKINTECIITDASQALLELLHSSNEELIGSNFFDYEEKNLEASLRESILEAVEKLRVYEFEESSVTTQNTPLSFKTTLVPEYSAHGKHIGFILFREDITAEKILLQNRKKIIENSRSAAMGEMISMIAHQWRQPLSLISTIIASLKIKKELSLLNEETILKSLDSIESTTHFMSETIDDFRNYFKPEKLVSEFNLLELFNKSIFFLKGEMEQKDIELKIIAPDALHLCTYKNELLQTILNIVKNSMDAFDESDIIEKKITITITTHASHIAIEIEDNAGGIPEEILPKVFEPYFSTKSKNGTGLGLYIVHTIITEHLQGSISISSQGTHTSTSIQLPYKTMIKEKQCE